MRVGVSVSCHVKTRCLCLCGFVTEMSPPALGSRSSRGVGAGGACRWLGVSIGQGAGAVVLSAQWQLETPKGWAGGGNETGWGGADGHSEERHWESSHTWGTAAVLL